MTRAESRVEGPATPRVGVSVATATPDALWLAGTTAVAAAAELILLRLGTRTAIHIPGIERVAGPFDAVAGVGRFAFFAATVLLTVTLVLLALRFARKARRVEAAAVTAFLLAAAVARTGVVDDDTLTIIVVAAVVALAVAAVGAVEGAGRVVPGLLGAAVVLAALHTLARTDVAWLLDGSEALAVVAALLSPLLLRGHPDRRAWIWGLVTAALVFLALGPGGATTRILLLWNVGLVGSLPAPLYALGVGALALTFVAAVRAGRVHLAVALTLLFVGGVAPHSTYQSGLIVAGLAVLGLGEAADAPSRGSDSCQLSETCATLKE